jgi:hypothetical protein
MIAVTRRILHPRLAIFTLFLIGLLSSCGKKGDDQVVNPPIEQTAIVPLVVGNEWRYVDSTFNTDGSVRIDSSTLAITGKTSVQYQGQTIEVYYWNWIDNRTKLPQDWKWLCRNESDGFCLFGGASSKGTFVLTKSLDIKFPGSVGDSWQRISIVTSGDSTFRLGDTTVVRCLAVSEDLSTPAGALKCYVTHYQRSRTIGSTTTVTDTYVYHVPNIGYVALLAKENGRTAFRKLLRTYHVSTSG